jgi:hypothetical protein
MTPVDHALAALPGLITEGMMHQNPEVREAVGKLWPYYGLWMECLVAVKDLSTTPLLTEAFDAITAGMKHVPLDSEAAHVMEQAQVKIAAVINAQPG